MPRGTGYRLEDFSVGDEVLIEHMFNGDEENYIPIHYGEFNPIGVIGIITRKDNRGNFPLRVELKDPAYFNTMGRKRYDVFKPTEISPITMSREPDWEV